MKQYKDEFLVFCLIFFLFLLYNIIEFDVRVYVFVLQMVFKLGLSYIFLVEVGLNVLEEWLIYIDRYVMQFYYKDIFFCLDGYLKILVLLDEIKNNWEVLVFFWVVQKGFNKVVLKYLKKIKNFLLNEVIFLEEIRIRVV